MATIYYRKLFEVRILHAYYLTDGTPLEFFALSEQQRNDILQRELFYGEYNVWRNLTIAPSEESKNVFSGYHIRFVPLRTGFLVAMRVRPVNNLFMPFVPFDETLNFTFNIGIKDFAFRNTTNYRLSSPVAGIYYLTNTDPEGNKTFPSLASPVAPFQNNHNYEMGELAVIGGDVMEAIEKANSQDPSKWRKVDGIGLVHDGDRILLPKRFYYTFPGESQVTSVSFTLRSSDGTALKSIDIDQTANIDRVSLDFMTTDDPNVEIEDGLFTLDVIGNNNFEDHRKVYLNDLLYNSGNLGVIQVNQNDSIYRLLEADGSLRNPAPVFEVRLKNRIAYWRYLSEDGKPFKVTPKTDPYLKAVNGKLLTIDPMPLTFFPIRFQKTDPAIERIFLPNPRGVSLRPENDGRIYSDIYSSKIKDLIAEDI